MLSIWLIRHGMTEGNLHGRYIGTTDEPLCAKGREALRVGTYPAVERVYTSPLLRCRETAGIFFPGMELWVIPELAECDFGEFENKNYQELSGNPNYQAWIDSNGTLPFPGGESREAFRERSVRGFSQAVTECIRDGITQAALVIHGGTIMNIMEQYALPERPFYDWHIKNGEGYLAELDTQMWLKGACRLLVKETVREESI